VEDLDTIVKRLKDAGCRFRTDAVIGSGGRQALVDDPSGNAVELFEPGRAGR
jgi:predicted enzyme related to lactoylglutathione lyase